MKRILTWLTLLAPLTLHACAMEPAFAADKPCPAPCVDPGIQFGVTGVLFLVLLLIFVVMFAKMDGDRREREHGKNRIKEEPDAGKDVSRNR